MQLRHAPDGASRFRSAIADERSRSVAISGPQSRPPPAARPGRRSAIPSPSRRHGHFVSEGRAPQSRRRWKHRRFRRSERPWPNGRITDRKAGPEQAGAGRRTGRSVDGGLARQLRFWAGMAAVIPMVPAVKQNPHRVGRRRVHARGERDLRRCRDDRQSERNIEGVSKRQKSIERRCRRDGVIVAPPESSLTGGPA